MIMNIGHKLKGFRLSKAITVEKLAAKIGLKDKAIYRIERSSDIGTKTIRKYLAGLDLSIDKFFGPDPGVINKNSVYMKLSEYSDKALVEICCGALAKRGRKERMISIESVSLITGIPFDEIKNIEEGIFNGKIEHLIMYLYFFGLDITINEVPFDKVEKNIYIGSLVEHQGLSSSELGLV
jgi:DNA-binding XRE family transcriptional regulator